MLAFSVLFADQELPVLAYIRQTWKLLARSNRSLAIAAVDPKVARKGVWPVYVPRDQDAGTLEREIREQMEPAAFQKIVIRPLPLPAAEIREPGLLYLPEPYVVPGGRFNEMYGWDSYFIQIGLLRDGEDALAKNMADNFLYEVRHYGKVLNANRTYYLTRSQPPFLTQMVLNIYRRTQDLAWLESSLPAIEAYYRYWVTEPHATPQTGLSRYFDSGDGPAPEVERNYYNTASEYFRKHTVSDYDANLYYDRAKNRLTPLFYQGDRAMRESGFDLSSRFGPFNVDIIRYNPVCLNSLLYLMESQVAEILAILHRGSEAESWRERASNRAAKINDLMWDAQDGLYYDYDFAEGRRRHYPFLTTFYPLWSGFASPEQAAGIVRNLPKFERPGGLQTSTMESGDQWDAPFAWAPLELIAIQGLRRYGYKREADRISMEFLSLIVQEYRKHGTIVEKYDAVRRVSNLHGEIHFGYRTNEAGFGWTNAVFTALYDELDPSFQKELR
jgi:alpha,alpha-trehalase